MKRTIFFLALGLFIGIGTSFNVFANTFRINNTLPTDITKKIYASLQEAHDDSTNIQNGDTLLVEGTNVEYNDFTCTRRLVIIGPGYLLTENQQSQANALSAVVKFVILNPGSDGSVIIGLVFSSGRSDYAPIISADNIAIIRCFLTNGISMGTRSINNLAIIQNYMTSIINLGNSLSSFGGVVFKNNILTADISIAQSTTAPRVFAVVENNIFLGNVKVSTNSFRSNIIVNEEATAEVASGGIQNNLVSNDQQLSAGSGTQIYDETALFVGLNGSGNSPDGQYRIKSDSPYLTAGYNGAEPGIFGGNEPYVISGIPPIPTIYDIQGDVIGSKQNGLNVTVKARTNP